MNHSNPPTKNRVVSRLGHHSVNEVPVCFIHVWEMKLLLIAQDSPMLSTHTWTESESSFPPLRQRQKTTKYNGTTRNSSVVPFVQPDLNVLLCLKILTSNYKCITSITE